MKVVEEETRLEDWAEEDIPVVAIHELETLAQKIN